MNAIEANADVGVTSVPHGSSSENVSARCESSSETAPLRGSYADVASVHRTSVAVDDVSHVTENSLPTRPLTVSFQPRYFLPACDVFEALSNADLQSTDVSCVQRLSSGAIVLTFRRPDHKEVFCDETLLLFTINLWPYKMSTALSRSFKFLTHLMSYLTLL